jgi:serine/threonine protein kinase
MLKYNNGYFKFEICTKNEIISLKINKFISEGNEAKVYDISEINNTKLSDIKLVAKVIVSKIEKNELQHFFLKINHVNIEKLYYLYERIDFSILVCEKLDLTLCELKFENLNHILYLASEIIEALVYLHTVCKIAHCDIKENNIMYSTPIQRFKLIDFNNCSHLSEFKKFKIRINIYRRPLQVLKNAYDWGFNVDIWALGATLYNLYYNSEILTESKIKCKTNDHNRLLILYYEKKINDLKKKKSIFYNFFVLNDIVLLKQRLKNILVTKKTLFKIKNNK